MKVKEEENNTEKLTTDQIETVKFDQNDFKDQFLEKSRFKLLFSHVASDILKRDESQIKQIMKGKKVKYEVEYEYRTINIRTTTKTRDPFIVIDCRDFVQLIIRGVPLDEAKKIFIDENTHLIFNLQSATSDKKVMINRRNRLIGPNQSVINGLRMSTGCFIQVEKKSVCVIGSYKQVLVVEEFIKKAMSNFHPVHLLKQLVAKNECKTDKEKTDMNWTNFIPYVTKKSSKKN